MQAGPVGGYGKSGRRAGEAGRQSSGCRVSHLWSLKKKKCGSNGSHSGEKHCARAAGAVAEAPAPVLAATPALQRKRGSTSWLLVAAAGKPSWEEQEQQQAQKGEVASNIIDSSVQERKGGALETEGRRRSPALGQSARPLPIWPTQQSKGPESQANKLHPSTNQRLPSPQSTHTLHGSCNGRVIVNLGWYLKGRGDHCGSPLLHQGR